MQYALRVRRCVRPSGQGAVLQQSPRPRRGAAHRPRLQRAGRRGHQAHEPVRRRDRRRCGRAYVRARDADALAAFGGIVGLNRPITAPPRALVSTFIEAVIAPGVDDEARPVLAGKPNLRVVTTDFAQIPPADRDIRSLVGALVEQSRDRVTEAAEKWPDSQAAGRDEAAAVGNGMAGAPVCVADLRAREVECGDLHVGGSHAGDWRGADEPRRRRPSGADESRRRQVELLRDRGCVRRLLSVPRWAGRRGRGRRDCRRSARRVSARRRGDCRRR